MSRHRNVRSMNYSEEYEGFDDVYGHSVEDDYCISPSDAGFLFDRTRQPQMSAFLNEENDIAEEEEGEEEATFVKPQLTDLEEAKLRSCVDEIQNVIGDMLPQSTIEELVLKFNFDMKLSLDNALNHSEAAAVESVPGDAKPRERKPKPRDKGFKTVELAEPLKTDTSPNTLSEGAPSVKVVTKGILTKGFDVGDTLKPPSNRSSPRCQSPADFDEASCTLDKVVPKSRESKVDAEQQYQRERGGMKEMLHMVVIGHVDAGKSTLMGHLLYALGQVHKKTMHKYEQESKKLGKQSFMYAWILDETGEERSRGITMDVGQSKFETQTKMVNLLDAPGHKDFIPNMITGATQADVAVLVVDATRGEFETGFESGGQTREHALLVRSLGVNQLAVVVNKLDTVGWSEDRFTEITTKLGAFLKQAGFRDSDVSYVPCSGLAGQNLVETPTEPNLTAWYKGPYLLQVIDNFKAPERPIKKPLRISVNDIYKGTGSGFCVSGRVETGIVQAGDRVLVLPQNETGSVKSITIDDMPVQTGFAGDGVSLNLANYDMENISVGYVICHPSHPVPTTTRFEARVVVFNVSVPITAGYPVVIHTQSLTEQAVVSKLVAQLHKGTGEVLKRRPRCLVKNSSAVVQVETSRPVCLELYRETKELGRFMLRVGGVSIAAGLVTSIF